MTYKESVDYLYKHLPVFHKEGNKAIKAGLNNIIKLSDYFGNPEKKYTTIHVAGTNGKGSVCHMLAAILQKAGYKTGLYTSPHLFDLTERIKINGIEVDKEFVASFVDINVSTFKKIEPSFFEAMTIMAFHYFAIEHVDVAVIETGLGGRLDSTNIVNPILSIITNVSFDHTEILGNTLQKIAYEKAGIIKPNTPVIIGETNAETKDVFLNKAKELDSPILFADQIFKSNILNNNENFQEIELKSLIDGEIIRIKTDLKGNYQQKNVTTTFVATKLLNELKLLIHEESILSGFAKSAELTRFKGRWQVLHQQPIIICDTGHNEAGISYVVNQLNKISFKKLHVIIGFVKEKDITKILSLLPANAIYYFTKANISRAMNEDELRKLAGEHSLYGKSFSNTSQALTTAISNSNKNDLIFIGGSTYVVGEILEKWENFSTILKKT